MLETYEAYADYTDVAAMTEELVALRRPRDGGHAHDRARRRDDRPHPAVAARHAHGSDPERDRDRHPRAATSATPCLPRCRQAGIDSNPEPGTGWGKLVDELLSKRVEPKLVQPTFVLDYPVELSPFAKPHRSEPGAGRALRGLHRRRRGRERLQRAQRPRRAARALRAAAAPGGGGRRGGAALRRGLPLRARAGHAADGRARARHRPAADDARGPALDPGGRAVPCVENTMNVARCTAFAFPRENGSARC